MYNVPERFFVVTPEGVAVEAVKLNDSEYVARHVKTGETEIALMADVAYAWFTMREIGPAWLRLKNKFV